MPNNIRDGWVSVELKKRDDEITRLRGALDDNEKALKLTAKEVLSLVRSEYDGEYSGMDAVSRCTNKYNHEYDHVSESMPPICKLCNGTGTIRRKLSNKELIEWAKSMANPASVGGNGIFQALIPFPYGPERIVKGE